MIQKVQLGNLNNYRVNNNNISKPDNNSSIVSHAPSFKSSGDYLYEETESLINTIKEKAADLSQTKLTAAHPDGTKITFTPERRGMTLNLENLSNITRNKYGLASRAEIQTRGNGVTYFSKYPSFMLCEMDEGEVDTLLQTYLPELLK